VTSAPVIVRFFTKPSMTTEAETGRADDDDDAVLPPSLHAKADRAEGIDSAIQHIDATNAKTANAATISARLPDTLF
jgi:hypothetical protein